MPVPFGTPAVAAWTAIFVLIAVFAILNWGVGMVLDAVLHPAPETVSAPMEPAGEPASVVVDLPPPLTPKVMPAAPAAAPAEAAPRRSARWDGRHYRHGKGSNGWSYRRSRETTEQSGVPSVGRTLNPAPGAAHHDGASLVRMEGLPRRIIDASAVHKEGVVAVLAGKPVVTITPPPAPTKP